MVGVYCQHVGAGTVDGDIRGHKQFAAGEHDRLSVQRRIEVDRVAVIGVRDRLTQRARAAVVNVGDGDCRCLSAQCDKARCAQEGCKQNPANT